MGTVARLVAAAMAVAAVVPLAPAGDVEQPTVAGCSAAVRSAAVATARAAVAPLAAAALAVAESAVMMGGVATVAAVTPATFARLVHARAELQ